MSHKQELEYLKKRNVELEAQVIELKCYIDAMSNAYKKEVEQLNLIISVLSEDTKRIKYKDFIKLYKDESIFGNSKQIKFRKFRFIINGKIINTNSLVLLGDRLGEYYVEQYRLDDRGKRFIIYLTDKED